MNIGLIISEKVEMLHKGFDKSQIKDEVFRIVFDNGIRNYNINSLIFQCMDIYSEIIKKYEAEKHEK